MKISFKISFLLFCFSIYSLGNAQDIIITKDAQKIEAKILEVSKGEIKYKKQNNLNGPTFVISTDELNSIMYANGEVQVFTQQKKPASVQQNVMQSDRQEENKLVETQRLQTRNTIYYANQFIGGNLPHFTYKKVKVPYYNSPKDRFVGGNMVLSQTEFIKFCEKYCPAAYSHKNDIINALRNYNENCAEESGEIKNVELQENSQQETSHIVEQEYYSNQNLEINQRPYIKRAMFNMYIDAGMLVSGNGGLGSSTNFTFGCRIKDYVFIGGSIGYDYFSDLDYSYSGYYYGYTTTDAHVVTEMVNVRVFIPVAPKVFPYFETSIGTSILCNIVTLPIPFRLKVGAGIDASRFSFGLGYDLLSGSSFYNDWESYISIYSTHSFYFKFGIRIGRLN